MSIDSLVADITPEIYQSMQKAIETGKWPNGVPVNEEQRANCLQIIIAYDELHKDTEERVGYLPAKPKGSPRRRDTQDNQEQPIRMLDK